MWATAPGWCSIFRDSLTSKSHFLLWEKKILGMIEFSYIQLHLKLPFTCFWCNSSLSKAVKANAYIKGKGIFPMMKCDIREHPLEEHSEWWNCCQRNRRRIFHLLLPGALFCWSCTSHPLPAVSHGCHSSSWWCFSFWSACLLRRFLLSSWWLEASGFMG